MSDPTSPQQPLPRPQPRPSSDDEPTLPYGVPSQQPPAYYQAPADQWLPQSNPYDASTQQVGDCTRLRGAPSVNDVSVSICFMAYVPEDAAVRTEVRRMTASVAQSI